MSMWNIYYIHIVAIYYQFKQLVYLRCLKSHIFADFYASYLIPFKKLVQNTFIMFYPNYWLWTFFLWYLISFSNNCINLFKLEVPPGFEPGIRVLQTHALPLGYGTKLNLINVFTQYIYACGLKIVLFYSKILKLLCNKKAFTETTTKYMSKFCLNRPKKIQLVVQEIFIIISYLIKNGAGNGAQTRDLCLGKAALYQLSYSRISFTEQLL